MRQDQLQTIEALSFLGDRSAELQQNAPFLRPLLPFQFSDAVSQLHHSLGFDEQRVAGGGAVMDLAR